MKTSIKRKLEDHSVSSLFKKSLICVAMLGIVGTSHGQQTADDENNDAEEVIEIRGIRASMAKNLAIKRLSNSIVDAITAEDIGKFPDKNVADSLQRVPGIIIQRSGGEGSTVSVRGLSSDLTFTQLNGNFIASSPGAPSRSFDFGLLPSSMIQKVEVHKSSEARLDEGGVGGTIILHSRQPLDMDANSGVLELEATYADVTDKYEPNFTGLYSWKNEDETFGFLVGLSRQERTNRSFSSSTAGVPWRWTGIDADAVDVNGNLLNSTDIPNNAPPIDALGNVYEDKWVPQVVSARIFEEDRIREGGQFTAQYRPSDQWELTFNYFSFTLSQDSTLSALDIPEWNYTTGVLTDPSFDPSDTILTGANYTAGATGVARRVDFPWIRGEFNREESTSDTFDFGGKFEGDTYRSSFKVGHTESKGGPEEQYSTAFYNANSGTRGSELEVQNAAQASGWRLEDQRLNLFLSPDTVDNLINGIGGGFDPGSSNSSFVRSTLEEDYAQVDFDFDVEWSIFESFKVGAKYRKAELHRETGNTFYLAPDFDIATAEAGDGIDRNDSYQWIGGEPALSEVLFTESIGNFPDRGFSANVFPGINWDAYSSYLNDNFVRYTRLEENFVFDIEEKITAAYAQGDFQHGDFRGNFGVRVVKTDTLSASSDIITYFLDFQDDVTEELLSGSDRFIDSPTTNARETSKTYVLPSFNIAWEATDDIVVRGALAKTIARPGYNELGAQNRLSYVSREWAEDRAAVNALAGWSGSGGNKNLEPFESLQADISLEYYYGEGSAIGIAFFNKAVDNFVVPFVLDTALNLPEVALTIPRTGEVEQTGGDGTIVPNFSTSANGTDATSRGIEVFVQHQFENGFGITSNYTLNDTNQAGVSVDGEKVADSELIGSSDFQFNFSAFYEAEKYSARVSYNLRGETVNGIQGGFNIIGDEYDQVDANASYEVAENLVLTASVINLTKSEQYTYLGKDTKDRLIGNVYTGRRYYAGISYKF